MRRRAILKHLGPMCLSIPGRLEMLPSKLFWIGSDPERAFLDRQAGRRCPQQERWRALTLLEMQRNALLMFTSCGWFFSDISGIETIQVMKYAARVIDLSAQLGLPSPRREFLEILAEAGSNRTDQGTGADVYLDMPSRASVSNSAGGKLKQKSHEKEVA